VIDNFTIVYRTTEQLCCRLTYTKTTSQPQYTKTSLIFIRTPKHLLLSFIVHQTTLLPLTEHQNNLAVFIGTKQLHYSLSYTKPPSLATHQHSTTRPCNHEESSSAAAPLRKSCGQVVSTPASLPSPVQIWTQRPATRALQAIVDKVPQLQRQRTLSYQLRNSLFINHKPITSYWQGHKIKHKETKQRNPQQTERSKGFKIVFTALTK
jgi:hypothetical protein